MKWWEPPTPHWFINLWINYFLYREYFYNSSTPFYCYRVGTEKHYSNRCLARNKRNVVQGKSLNSLNFFQAVGTVAIFKTYF